ncbi:MAG TPA: hypothetical protein VMT00_02965 [Thermoanaerobaculia bacterium]|nr:hypothetical protein [Thermoanaerobaculia bacterium]
MRKPILLFALILLVATQAFAAYVVVLKDGTRYRAREPWKMSGSKALISLENGSVLEVDPALIDVAKTNEINNLGLGDVKIISVQTPSTTPPPPETSSLGSVTKLRKIPGTNAPAETSAPKPVTKKVEVRAQAGPTADAGGKGLGQDVLSKFFAAYDNVGLFDAVVTSTQPGRIRVEMTTDNEDKVFKAISATSYMLLRVPEATGSEIEMVELFMKTINGGTAGRFQMTADDARAIDTKKLTIPTYFVQKVVF